jgi:isoamylase
MRNMLVALAVAAGTPMFCMGDEYGHTKLGNNNGWCQDSDLTWFSWNKAAKERDSLLRFTQKLIQFRRDSRAMHHREFLTDADISWHSVDWKSSYNFVSFVLRGSHEDVFVAFNAGGSHRTVDLPHAAKDRGPWCRMADTNLASPRDFADNPSANPMTGGNYQLAPFSSLILKQCCGESKSDADNVDDLANAFNITSVSELM